MRKLLSALWVLFLISCLTVSVVATDASQRIDVTAKYTSESFAPATYCVDISWTDMTFTYTDAQTHIWNPSDHSYKSTSRGNWDKTKATVTVTNHSNVDVQVKVTFEAVEGTGVTGVLKNASRKLKAGETGNYDGADSMTTTLTIKGTPTKLVSTTGTKIGNIVISIQ